MHLKVLTWNLRRANRDSEIWVIVRNINPDIMILQEVASIPDDLLSEYSWLSKKARSKRGVYSSQADPLFQHTDPSDQDYFMTPIPAC